MTHHMVRHDAPSVQSQKVCVRYVRTFSEKIYFLIPQNQNSSTHNLGFWATIFLSYSTEF